MVDIKNKKVLLLHGYTRTSEDMGYLNMILNGNGYSVDAINMPLTYDRIDKAKKMIKKYFLSLDNDEKIYAIAHSTGGIVLNEVLTEENFNNIVEKIVYIAVPFKGTKLASLCRYTLLPKIHKTLCDLYTERNIDKKISLKEKVLLLAGNRNNLLLGRIFLNNCDGRVTVDSAIPDKSYEYKVYNYNHLEIHHTNEVSQDILAFFDKDIE